MERRTVLTPGCCAHVSAPVAANPRAVATGLYAAGGTRSCLGRPALEAGASQRAAYALDRRPRRRTLVEAPGASLGDWVVSAPRHRRRYGACSGSPARAHP